MADQDDFWHPDKLASLLGEPSATPSSPTATQRIVQPRRATPDRGHHWSRRRPKHESLLVASGGQLGHRRRVALSPVSCSTTRCRFRPRQFTHFHDHWLALTRRLARGRSLSSIARCTTTCSIAARSSATQRRTACPHSRDRLMKSCGRIRATGCRALAALTISSTAPAHPVHDRPQDALRFPHERLQALEPPESFPRAERSPVALANLARRAARELVSEPGDARRRDGSLLRLRVASPLRRRAPAGWSAPAGGCA